MSARSTHVIAQAVLSALLLFPLSARAQNNVTGLVKDPSGAAISEAGVEFHSAHYGKTLRTDASGKFNFADVPDSAGTITVSAKGFSPSTREWSASQSVELAFVLQPVSEQERVVVSASRTEMMLSDVPGSAVQISADDIKANPALTIDDMLRQVPGFSLFKRSSSRIANPTTEGVSLRGLGASGPSRALVLEDGIPLVDPFGGWVYWDRIPREALSSV